MRVHEAHIKGKIEYNQFTITVVPEATHDSIGSIYFWLFTEEQEKKIFDDYN